MILRTRSFSSSVPFFARTKRKKNPPFLEEKRPSSRWRCLRSASPLPLVSKAEKAYHRDDSFGEGSFTDVFGADSILILDSGGLEGRLVLCNFTRIFTLCSPSKLVSPWGSLSFGGAAFLFLVKYRTLNDKKHGNYIWKYGRLELSPASSSGTEPGWAASAKSKQALAPRDPRG